MLSTMALSPAHAERKSYAVMHGDTLKLGNSLVERTFLWNGGALKTVRLVNKQHKTAILAKGTMPDFAMVKAEVDSACIKTEWLSANGVHPAYLRVSVWSRQGTLECLRQFRVYDDCPAIACDYYLKGRINPLHQSTVVNHADRKNIESTADMGIQLKTPTIDRIQLDGNHWQTRVVEFLDYTDWNDNLVIERQFIFF